MNKKILHKIQQLEKKTYRNPKCLHPNASLTTCDKIIKAHSLQRKGVLNRIAENNDVYKISSGGFRKIQENQGRLTPQLTPIITASIFHGFCKEHDKIFCPIEDTKIEPTHEQAFLIGYRALCREYYGITALSEFLTNLLKEDLSQNLHRQIAYSKQLKNEIMVAKRQQKILKTEKLIWDKAWSIKDYSSLRYYSFRLLPKTGMALSGAKFINYDFLGEPLQIAFPQDIITFSLLPQEIGGFGIFCWLGNSNINEQLVRSFNSLKEEQLDQSSAILRFAFEYFENLYLSPSWWDAIPFVYQEFLIDRFNRAARNIPTTKSALIYDGLHAEYWRIHEFSWKGITLDLS